MLSIIDMAPPILRRHERWYYLGMFGLFGSFLLLGVLFMAGHLLLPQNSAVVIATVSTIMLLMLASIGVGIWSFLAALLASKRIKAKGLSVCGCCGYDLVGMLEPGRCPECSAPCDPRRLRGFWNRWDRFRLGLWARRSIQQVPPWVSRTLFLTLGGMLLAEFALLAGVAMAFNTNYAVTRPFFLAYALPLTVKLAWAMTALRICRRVTARAGLACPQCGGDMVIDGADAECTKCRARRPASAVREQWDFWKPPCWNIEMEA